MTLRSEPILVRNPGKRSEPVERSNPEYLSEPHVRGEEGIR